MIATPYIIRFCQMESTYFIVKKLLPYSMTNDDNHECGWIDCTFFNQ